MASTPEVLVLRGTTWNHSRGFTPMVATAQRYSELHPGVEIIWDKRSLQAFGDQSVDTLAARYDLLVIDHPWAGMAASSGVLLPLDEHLPASFLREQAANSVGASHRSYITEARQWALAIDAAAPVASWRPDLLAVGDIPQTWDGLMQLAHSGKVLLPGTPVDTLMNFYMICSTLGEDVCRTSEAVVSSPTGTRALEMLRELAQALDPIVWELNPIRVYETMTALDRFAYCPFAFGYSNYARPGYARKLLAFGDMVEIEGRRCRTTLGGAGLAISSRCAHMKTALDYAVFVSGPACQSTLYFDSGGQPGHRLAWTDERVNASCRDYFRNTLPVLDRAFMRPRYSGYVDFQSRAGHPVHEYLRDGGSVEAVLAELNALHHESQTKTG